MLLVLDNFEQILPAASQVAELLIGGAGTEGAGDQSGTASLSRRTGIPCPAVGNP